ncbi:DUF2948 family protein [Neogemmobacter tilapiae]|uniref:DUF2948 family protein n=1 Tax=Neogemmobacter tilapiae TaxID=875041 RepID=A0A918TM89_9RHOB|nr:DUF2948 family protein [Gemmobacter tilapiae]GHC54060.1 hypothetical protein GCM10007315_16080 [Gemmobacter tilapiae]
MTRDAGFADGAEGPLALIAQDHDDLNVMAALVQDAVFDGKDMAWQAKPRQFALLLNRFRWEDRVAAERAGRPFERVRAVLSFQDVLGVKVQGFDRNQAHALLGMTFVAAKDGMGRIVLTLSGGGRIALDVEALDATLKDVTRPHVAPSGKAPQHEI